MFHIVILFLITLCVQGERHLLCSSEMSEIWYSYSGGFDEVSATISPCFYSRLTQFSIKYKAIPRFDMVNIYYNFYMVYENHKVLEMSGSVCDEAIEDLTICGILKGETISQEISVYTGPYELSQGTYEAVIKIFHMGNNMQEPLFTSNATVSIK
ncbi:lymphocyte antigen 96 [Amia ocellicauda]|uniref:lymphocyte antigen 96 n=1 Tax=Amia ocellicauda TaxID=2972642 RepID=UPI003463D194